MNKSKYALQYTFTHNTATHRFDIPWTRIGATSNPALVLIHGTPWSSIVWHDLASVLKDRYCIYMFDHPGFENSPQPTRLDGKESELDPGLSLRAQASAALFQHWSLARPPHIVAHDNGGLVSLRLYLEHGIRFQSLCLVDVVALGPFGLPFFDLVANNQSVFQNIPAKFVDGFVRSYISTASYKGLSRQTEDMLARQWLDSGSQGPARFLQEMVQAHNRTTGELEKEYSRVGGEIPVKVVWGADDSWLPSEIAHRVSTALDAREVVLIEEAGHLVHYDHPSKLAFEVGTWLMKND